MFSAVEIAALKRRRVEGKPLSVDDSDPVSSNSAVEIDGATAARVFEQFDWHNSPVQVVESLRLPPVVVKTLYMQWLELQALAGR